MTVDLARPFTLQRSRDYHVSNNMVPGFMSLYTRIAERLLPTVARAQMMRAIAGSDTPPWVGQLTLPPCVIRFASYIEPDTRDRRSKVVKWDQGTITSLVVPHAGSTDRHVSSGDVAVTLSNEASVRFTVNRFHYMHVDAEDVSVCRDAWLAGDRDRSVDIAKVVCPHTWPVLLVACEVERLQLVLEQRSGI